MDQRQNKVAAALTAYEPSLRERIGNVTYDVATYLGLPYANRMRSDIETAVDFIPGAGDAVGVNEAARDYQAGNYLGALGGMGLAAVGMVPAVGDVAASGLKKGFRAFHGSPHDFDRFDISRLGTGEGKQAEGYGIYVAEARPTGEHYRDILSNKISPDHQGVLYELDINASPEEFVDWNSPLSGQPDSVKAWFDSRGISEGFAGQQSGAELLMAERGVLGDEGIASSMKDAGIPGIRYLDQLSRGSGNGTRNYVIFDDSIINIVKKYGVAGALSAGLITQEMASQMIAQGGIDEL